MTLKDLISELESLQHESFTASRSAMLRGDVARSDKALRRITALEHALAIVSNYDQVGSHGNPASNGTSGSAQSEAQDKPSSNLPPVTP